MNKYLSYSLIPFLLVLAFCSLASKQEDGFRINVGDEFYSEIIELNKGKLVGQKAPLKQEQICNLIIELLHLLDPY